MKILVSPEYGSGWSTMARSREAKYMMLTDERLIAAVESTGRNSPERAAALAEFLARLQASTGESPCILGFSEIEVVEVSGTFEVHEYDGYESVKPIAENDDIWTFV